MSETRLTEEEFVELRELEHIDAENYPEARNRIVSELLALRKERDEAREVAREMFSESYHRTAEREPWITEHPWLMEYV